MHKMNLRPILSILLSAITLSLLTLSIQTGSQPFASSEIKDYSGAPCAFGQYGFPFKALSSVEEPCAYAMSLETKPSGMEVNYSFVAIPALLANIATWSVLLAAFAMVHRKITDKK